MEKNLWGRGFERVVIELLAKKVRHEKGRKEGRKARWKSVAVMVKEEIDGAYFYGHSSLYSMSNVGQQIFSGMSCILLDLRH